MKPEDVPGELMSLGRNALVQHDRAVRLPHLPTFEERVRAVLAAVLPEHEKQLWAERDALKAELAEARKDLGEALSVPTLGDARAEIAGLRAFLAQHERTAAEARRDDDVRYAAISAELAEARAAIERLKELRDQWYRQPGMSEEADALDAALGASQRPEDCAPPTVDCRSPEGVTVGLIDGIIAAARVLRSRDLTHPAVVEALRDIAEDEDVRSLLNASQRPEDTREETGSDVQAFAADVARLVADYSNEERGVIALMPFEATLDQLCLEKYGFDLDKITAPDARPGVPEGEQP